jgi:hypothetical protein
MKLKEYITFLIPAAVLLIFVCLMYRPLREQFANLTCSSYTTPQKCNAAGLTLDCGWCPSSGKCVAWGYGSDNQITTRGACPDSDITFQAASGTPGSYNEPNSDEFEAAKNALLNPTSNRSYGGPQTLCSSHTDGNSCVCDEKCGWCEANNKCVNISIGRDSFGDPMFVSNGACPNDRDMTDYIMNTDVTCDTGSLASAGVADAVAAAVAAAARATTGSTGGSTAAPVSDPAPLSYPAPVSDPPPVSGPAPVSQITLGCPSSTAVQQFLSQLGQRLNTCST